MSSNANFATTPRQEVVQATTANTAWDGTGAIVTLFTAGPNGSRVDQIGWAVCGTSAEGLFKFFVRKSSEDTWKFMYSGHFDAVTASATQGPWNGGATNLNWVLTSGAQIGVAVSINVTMTFHVSLAGDF